MSLSDEALGILRKIADAEDKLIQNSLIG